MTNKSEALAHLDELLSAWLDNNADDWGTVQESDGKSVIYGLTNDGVGFSLMLNVTE